MDQLESVWMKMLYKFLVLSAVLVISAGYCVDRRLPRDYCDDSGVCSKYDPETKHFTFYKKTDLYYSYDEDKFVQKILRLPERFQEIIQN